MNHKSRFSELIISFCVCTSCITLLEGILGMLFFPDELLPYKAFLSPPLFGFLSVLLGMVTWSKRELSMKQVLFRRVIHLLLIEGMVFGLNYASGIVFPPIVVAALAIGIAVVFVAVYVILWINDQKSANLFNQKLKEYQEIEKQNEV